MKILDPVADVRHSEPAAERRPLADALGQRMGILWGQHAATAKFRPTFVEVAREEFRPAELHVVTKYSTWNPAADTQMQELANEVDFAIIGVGA